MLLIYSTERNSNDSLQVVDKVNKVMFCSHMNMVQYL